MGEAALRRLRPRARQIPDVARPALLNASVPRAAARALWAQASSEVFGHWDAEIFSDAARCADWFTQTPSVCDAPLAFLHMAGYGNKKFRPMLLRLLSKRRANFSAACERISLFVPGAWSNHDSSPQSLSRKRPCSSM